MNKDKALIKTFNYGLEKHEVITSVEMEYETETRVLKKVKDNKIPRMLTNNARSEIAKYLIEVNRNKELSKILESKKWLFKRFIEEVEKPFDKPLKLKKFKNKTASKITIKAFKVSKALLSYALQAEELLKKYFCAYKKVKVEKYMTSRPDDILGLRDKEPKFLKLYDYEQKAHRMLKVTLDDDKRNMQRRYVIKNVYHKRFTEKNATMKLYVEKFQKINYYNKFLKLLSEFFEKVNVHNDYDFDKYLDEEVVRLTKYLGDGELEKLQREYNNRIKRNDSDNNGTMAG
jgi:hypothetical protein